MGEWLDSLNPATGEVVGSVEITPVEEIPAIVACAREAAAGWRGVDIAERGRLLVEAAVTVADSAAQLGALITQEMGKPLRDGVAEAQGCGSGTAGKVAGIVDALRPETLEKGGRSSTIYHDPFGVCAAITPWNYPMSMVHWLVVPALVAGNTVVLKPSEETPLTGQAYADALSAMLPPGVLQVVQGADRQGKALVRSDVDLIAFTGSRDAGKHIMAAAAESLKRIVLELGGKDPLIVLADADVGRAARFAAANSFDNSGQACISTERIYVAEQIAEEFEQAVAARADRLVVGDGMEDPDIGPLVNARQLDHVMHQIDDAVRRGARVLVGGEAADGLFIAPTVLADATDSMRIMRDETFGPVACIARFHDVDEAVTRANSGPYGLGAVVFGSEASASSVARRLEAGMIGVNRSLFGPPGMPWVGAKQSGFGFHGSADGHRQFTQTRVITERVG